MRCGCPQCGAYMAHAESMRLGCVCPQCGARCSDCMGTNTLVGREAFETVKRLNAAKAQKSANRAENNKTKS